MSFHIQNNHHATLSQIDKANDHNSVCLLRGGIKREDLPADLSDISYPVNCYCSFKQSDLAFIPAYLTFNLCNKKFASAALCKEHMSQCQASQVDVFFQF